MEKLIVVSPMRIPTASPRGFIIPMIGNNYPQQRAKSMISSSIVYRAVSVCNFDYDNTGKSSKVITYPVIIFTHYGSVGFS